MFSHVILGVNNLDVSKKFYDAVLGALGVPAGIANKNRYFYRSPTGTLGGLKSSAQAQAAAITLGWPP